MLMASRIRTSYPGTAGDGLAIPASASDDLFALWLHVKLVRAERSFGAVSEGLRQALLARRPGRSLRAASAVPDACDP